MTVLTQVRGIAILEKISRDSPKMEERPGGLADALTSVLPNSLNYMRAAKPTLGGRLLRLTAMADSGSTFEVATTTHITTSLRGTPNGFLDPTSVYDLWDLRIASVTKTGEPGGGAVTPASLLRYCDQEKGPFAWFSRVQVSSSSARLIDDVNSYDLFCQAMLVKGSSDFRRMIALGAGAATAAVSLNGIAAGGAAIVVPELLTQQFAPLITPLFHASVDSRLIPLCFLADSTLRIDRTLIEPYTGFRHNVAANGGALAAGGMTVPAFYRLERFRTSAVLFDADPFFVQSLKASVARSGATGLTVNGKGYTNQTMNVPPGDAIFRVNIPRRSLDSIFFAFHRASARNLATRDGRAAVGERQVIPARLRAYNLLASGSKVVPSDIIGYRRGIQEFLRIWGSYDSALPGYGLPLDRVGGYDLDYSTQRDLLTPAEQNLEELDGPAGLQYKSMPVFYGLDLESLPGDRSVMMSGINSASTGLDLELDFANFDRVPDDPAGGFVPNSPVMCQMFAEFTQVVTFRADGDVEVVI